MNYNSTVNILFFIIISILILIDILNKKKTIKNNIIWSLIWILCSIIFSVCVAIIYYNIYGLYEAINFVSKFQAAYWIEKSLSLDNIFIFILIFRHFNIPNNKQNKILLYGVIGAIIFRILFIIYGYKIIELSYIDNIQIGKIKFILKHNELPIIKEYKFNKINITMLIFAIIIILTAVKSLFTNKQKSINLEKNIFLIFFRRYFKIYNFETDKFFIKKNNTIYITNLFVCLVIIELTDIIFAFDSIPAIFNITENNKFISYTSNIFAILGLRSMYILLSNYIDKFSNLRTGISIILLFIGLKMMIQPLIHIHSLLSTLIILIIIIISIISSKKIYY